MRKTITLFLLFLSVTIGFTQNHAKTVSKQSIEWLEKNEHASKAIQFSADVLSDAVELFWEVNKEQAIAGYELQRSTNGEHFKKIAWFASVGEGEVGGTYLYLDETPFQKDVIQYRIKAVRKDGQYLYSATQIIDIQLSRPTIDLSASSDIRPAFIPLADKGLDTSQPIKLIDASGKTILQLSPTHETLRMDLSRLQKGVYFIKMVLADGEDKIERIVKEG